MKIDINPQIISFLEENLIKPTNGLKDIYDRIIKYHELSSLENNNSNNLIEILNPTLLSKHQLAECLQKENATTMAIDFPIEIKESKDSKRPIIMVCALDSLPPDISEKNLENHWKIFFKEESYSQLLEKLKIYITPWVPFSLIENWKLEKGSFKQNVSFFSTLFNKYDLYVTDIYKLFYRKENKKSTFIHKEEELNTFKIILRKEVELVKPKAIVTLGNKSRNALLNFILKTPERWSCDVQNAEWIEDKENKKTQIISIPHISGAANGAKSMILKNPKYDFILEKNTVKLARIVIDNIEKGKAENL